jgi:hypothetical protein
VPMGLSNLMSLAYGCHGVGRRASTHVVVVEVVDREEEGADVEVVENDDEARKCWCWRETGGVVKNDGVDDLVVYDWY